MSASAREVLAKAHCKATAWCGSDPKHCGGPGGVCLATESGLLHGGHYKTVDQQIDALSAAGFVIVPREPTDVMLEAAYQAQIDDASYEPWPTDPSGAEYVSEWVCARIAYRAMVSAAEGKQ